MGWIVCLPLLLSLFPDQDLRSDRESLFEALENPSEERLEKSLLKCLSHQSGVVRILHSAWIRSEKSIQAHREKEADFQKKMEKFDDSNRHSKDADPFAFLKARRDRNETRNQINLLKLYQGRILRGILSRRSPEEIKDLIRLLKDGAPVLRAYAALALGNLEGKLPRKALLGAGKRERTPLVRVALLDALAGDPEALVTFERDLRNDHWQVQLSAARALGKTKDRASAEALIKRLPKVTGRIAHEFNEALKSITGVDKRGNAAVWQAWWEENKEEFLAGKYVPAIGERAEDPGHSTFYGIRIRSTRILFLLDVSPSMKRGTTWRPSGGKELKGDRLIDVAKHELQQMLGTLPSNTTFNVMMFWKDRRFALEKPGRGRRDVQTAMEFVEEITLQDGTNHWEAFCDAFRVYGEATPKSNLPRLDFDTIYLISDGLPSQGIRDPSILTERLEDLNRFRKIAIHTIALEPDGNGKRFLGKIAETNGGRHVER